MSLCRLSDCAEALEVMRPDLAAWLQTVAKRIKHGLPAAAALELVGSSARKERDRLLAMAAVTLRQPEETWWQVSQRLASRITTPPRRHPDTTDRLLAQAGEVAPLPRSARRIYDLLLARL